MKPMVVETDFPSLQLIQRGKVRDVYDLGETLLMVATDRISAFDVVLPNAIPDKGIVLNQISLYWFNIMQSIVPNHLITSDVNQFPEICRPYAKALQRRSMLVRKTIPLPIECIVRGYLSGSGWKSYCKDQTICGIKLPEGLRESDRLPRPLFTPSTKAEKGDHDINISFEAAQKKVGADVAEKVKALSLAIYEKGFQMAAEKGIIIADTKFEFGFTGDEIILIDEVLTPDSSRFWPKDSYAPGGSQKSFDKQYVRDYLESVDWNKKDPGPSLPDEVVIGTRNKYAEALERITGDRHGL
jgi:phosphoribosylaminoimidazole-succinocarboxamide synthase